MFNVVIIAPESASIKELALKLKRKVEVVCHDGECSLVVETIRLAAKTGRIGDGKIFVLPVESATRIRTGETGDSVI